MQFRCLNATFGNLTHRVLTFAPGLNIVEAPNESGKSTLAAFLRTMLYGLKTNERGTLADKNRYAPWSGGAMSGTLELSTELGNITLQRNTARANAPMGHFSAIYTGTSEEVVQLTAAGCGETLLGIPREVYERSAFIRQSGLAIDADAELERRIAALITTGEEGASYSETANVLKKQLNSRRHNKTGKIPLLEQEIAADADSLAELRNLTSQRKAAEAELAARKAEQDTIRSDLALHDAADRQAQFEALREAKHTAEEADAKAETAYRMILDAKTPPREVLEQGKAKLHALNGLNAQHAEAEKKRQEAWDACEAFSSTMSAKRRSCLFDLISWTVPTLFILLSIPFARRNMWTHAVVCSFLSLFNVALNIILSCRRERKYGAQLRHESELLNAAEEAEDACSTINTACEAQLELLLTDIPVSDAAQAEAYISEALSRYELHENLSREAQMAQMQLEFLQKQLPAEEPTIHVERPVRSRETLQSALTDVTARCTELQRTVDYTEGRIRAIGDAQELETTLHEKQERLTVLQDEYNAIALAMEALERANTTLQNRFSPALGERAAELFGALTGGKYNKVLLDRAFRALVDEDGASVSRDAALLSQGAADQLYLAVRLAICDLVLPAEKNIPLVLDDALINFDDTRCANALELLLRESEKRQILLLTCQHREAAYLSGREGVNVLTL